MKFPSCACSIVVTAIFLSSCTAPRDTADLDRPLYSSDGKTTFITSPTSGELKIRDAVAIAKVLRKYRDLTAAEQALVKLAVKRHFDGIVALEVRKLELLPANVAERQRIQRIPDARARKLAKAKYDEQIFNEAARSARLLFGRDEPRGVLCKTSTNKTAVVFTRSNGSNTEISDAAYLTDTPTELYGSKTKVSLPNAPDDAGLRKISQGATASLVITDNPITIK